jgi:hypothetical protein
MITVLDTFALSFDSIDVDPTRAPLALEHAHEIAASLENEPGFYLRDNAGGRFVVDRDTGLVTLANRDLLQHEPDAIHRVRLYVIEQSGERYELDLNLRINGAVPHVVGAEDMALATPAEPVAPVARPRRRIAFATAPAAKPATVETAAALTPWNTYAVANQNAGKPAPLQNADAAFGALIAAPPAPALAISGASLALADQPPAPSAADAPWSL